MNDFRIRRSVTHKVVVGPESLLPTMAGYGVAQPGDRLSQAGIRISEQIDAMSTQTLGFRDCAFGKAGCDLIEQGNCVLPAFRSQRWIEPAGSDPFQVGLERVPVRRQQRVKPAAVAIA